MSETNETAIAPTNKICPEILTAWCVKCHAIREVKTPVYVDVCGKRGARTMLKGKCGICGSTMSKIAKKV